MIVYHSLAPVYDKNCKILILGSFPSVKSRELGFYYMHKTNRFWQVLEQVYEEKIIDKKSFLLKHHLALFDVVYSCEIENSKDTSIKKVKPNDINKLLKESQIKKIYTTGKKAHELYMKYIYPKTKISDICLPSTSSANASYTLNDLKEKYQILKDSDDDERFIRKI